MYSLTYRPAEDGHPPIAGFLLRFLPISSQFFSPLFEGFSSTRESFTSNVIWGIRADLPLSCLLLNRLCDSLLARTSTREGFELEA